MSNNTSITSAMITKVMERYSSMACQIIVQILLTRILSPHDYGLVAMMTVFINISSLFINNGFGMAVVQKQTLEDQDIKTAFTINLLMGGALYAIIFFAAPSIAYFYNQEQLCDCLRVLALVLVIGSLNSIQTSLATRKLLMKKLFVSNITSCVISGAIGIGCAYSGLGYWSLIIQQLSACIISTLILNTSLGWRPAFGYSHDSAKSMFGFGWKLFAAGLLNTTYNELSGLIIGKKYSASDMAFFSKGKTFPSTISSGFDSAIHSVMFSAFSRNQDKRTQLLNLFSRTIATNTYLICFCLGLFAVIVPSLTVILFTEKWLPLVPFARITCITLIFHPLAAAQVQAITSIGRSDIRLLKEIIAKTIGIIMIILCIPYGPIGIALGMCFSGIISISIGALFCQKYVNAPIIQSLKHMLPNIGVMTIAIIVSYIVSNQFSNHYLNLSITTVTWILVYFALSHIFHVSTYVFLSDKIKAKYQK